MDNGCGGEKEIPYFILSWGQSGVELMEGMGNISVVLL